nr:retrovirus-related Pol polyprotein from transposon TNT 1-94 [Tanacetum cinerariifolium]
MTRCLVFIHNHKDYLGKFDAKADDVYFLRYSSVSKAFRVYNIRRQQIEETYHVTFDESMKAIRFTNSLVDKIGIDDSSRYLPDEFLYEDDPSRQYQDDQRITQPTDVPLGNNTEASSPITEPLVPDVPRNKKDEHGTTTKNKARLVTQGHSQEKGIDYDETFAPVARMEAIRIFFAFGTYMNFKVYQIDVKSAFLNALYGVKQAPIACPMCKISVQSKGITSNSHEKNPQTMVVAIWIEKAAQVPAKYLVESSLVRVPRNSSLLLDVVQVLGGNYSSTEQVNSIQQPLAYSLITGTEDPSKVTDIELTAYIIAVNNWRDSVSQPPLVAKPKKGKSQTVALTFPKSQGLEASEALSKKRTKPKSKRPPTETKESPPKPTEGSEQSHSVSSGTVPNPQDQERNIQLFSMGLPSTLNEGTRKSQPFPESTVTPPKDSGGNDQPLDRDLTFTTFNEGTAKTTPRLEGSPILLFEDEAQESDEEVLATGDDMDEDPRDDKEVRTSSLKQDQHAPSHVQESASDSSSPDLRRFDNILPLTERKLIKYLRKMSRGFDLSTLLSAVKSIQDHVVKQEEAIAAWMKTSTNMAWNLGSRMSRVELSQTALKREISSLRQDTFEIKSMMTKMYAAF